MSDATALSAHGLGKRFGSTWALRDCTLDIPVGSVTALVGPNGAGKTTLLQLAVGLIRPTTGELRVLGLVPRDDASALLPRVAFVAQDHPLHRRFTVRDMLKLGQRLNPSWDDDVARARIERLGLPLDRKIGKLSGGQQTQVALTLALAKRPGAADPRRARGVARSPGAARVHEHRARRSSARRRSASSCRRTSSPTSSASATTSSSCPTLARSSRARSTTSSPSIAC